MKFWKHTIVSALAFLGVSSTVLYTACEKDSCIQLKCQNDAPCVDGFCVCKEGFEGEECRGFAADRFTGNYIGSSVRNNLPYKVDSAYVTLQAFPNYVNFRIASGDSKGNKDAVYGGKISGHNVTTKDEATGTYFQMVEDGEKITVFIEEVVDGKKNTISFTGNIMT
jgi:hypothetical protein